MDRFSTDLQTERLRHGASLDDIARLTKVPARHLVALEEGRLADLPGGIFRKGILRSYLQAIGIAPAPWMPRFEALLASQDLTDPVLDLPSVAATVDRAQAAPAPFRPAPAPLAPAREPYRWSGLVVALVLLLAFGWCVWRYALRGRVTLSFAAPPPVHRVVPAVEEHLPAIFDLR